MVAFFLVFLFAASGQIPVHPPQTSDGAQLREAKDQAQAQAIIGHNQLHLGRLSDAQANCDSALKLEPSNVTAKDCLDWAATMLIDQDLNNADAKLLSGDKAGGSALASKWARAGAPVDRRKRAWSIMRLARTKSLRDRYNEIVPLWLRDLLVTMVILIGLGLLLFLARKIWRAWQRGKWYGDLGKTNWSMLPLKELPPAEQKTGIPTDEVLDALARVGHELARGLWEPKLLLLKPTPPANYEPALISDFLSSDLRPLVLAPPAEDLQLEWQLHEVQLDQALQNLQLKTAAGIDIGSVARLLRSIIEWINAGAPKISGVAQTDADKTVSILLAATGGRTQLVAVTASTSAAPGLDPTHLSAERAALKFLFRMRYPCMTNDEIDGFSALRQGACQFAQFSGTVPGAGDDAKTRKSVLAKAAFNFGFFRASIPSHSSSTPPSKQSTSLDLNDNIRQAVLLAEGVAHALVGEDSDQMLAIDCFRQLEDWPGSAETLLLRQQSTYNEAVVWRQRGSAGRCVLMLTELLGERAPDTVEVGRKLSASTTSQKPLLPDPIRFPARLARLAAFATYTREEWGTLPESRAQLLIDDAEKLIEDLCSLCQQKDVSAHDLRLANYMYIEALRAIGHVELLRVITGSAASLYSNNRPVRIVNSTLAEDGSKGLGRAIGWMLQCEEVSPSCDLFCDLAEAYLLLKDFTLAQGYARHATLESNPCHERSQNNPYYERAYYIATESFFLENTDSSKAFARKYATDFKGTVQLDEFKAVRADLGIQEAPSGSAVQNTTLQLLEKEATTTDSKLRVNEGYSS